MEELDDVSIRRLELYKRSKGCFVTIIKKDGFTVAGILIDITPDNHLFVKGKHKECVFHFLEINDFSARPNRNQNRGGTNS